MFNGSWASQPGSWENDGWQGPRSLHGSLIPHTAPHVHTGSGSPARAVHAAPAGDRESTSQTSFPAGFQPPLSPACREGNSILQPGRDSILHPGRPQGFLPLCYWGIPTWGEHPFLLRGRQSPCCRTQGAPLPPALAIGMGAPHACCRVRSPCTLSVE